MFACPPPPPPPPRQDESLARLGTSYVDILQLHDIEFAPSLDIIINETLPGMLAHVQHKRGCARFGRSFRVCRHIFLQSCRLPLHTKSRTVREASACPLSLTVPHAIFRPAALAKVRESGKARFIGITGYPTDALRTVLERSTVKIDTMLSYCRSVAALHGMRRLGSNA